MSAPAQIVARLMAVFGEPKTPDPDQFLAEFELAISREPESFLQQATSNLIRTSSFWPRPAEIIAEVRRLAAEQARYRPPEHRPYHPVSRTPEQRAAAQALVDNMRKFLAANVVSGPDEKREVDWQRGQRPQMEEMQRDDRRDLHRAKRQK